MSRPVRFVDLFAGIGGFHRAATRVMEGSKCVLAVEWDRDCQKVYSAAFAETPLRGDVHDVLSIGADQRRPATAQEILDNNLIPPHDILFAGFPCQPFSKGGHQLGLEEQTQGTLFHEILRIVVARRPPLVVLENVANLVGHDEGRTWTTIVRALRDADYSVDENPLILSPREFNASAGGAPQNRPRVYVVAVDERRGLTAPSNAALVRRSDLRDGKPWSITGIFKHSHTSETSLDARETEWLEAWDDFVKIVEDDALPGFPIWMDAWYGRMRRPGRRAGSGATLRANRTGDREIDARWWHDFIAKNERFYARHRKTLDAWVTRWGVDRFPESRRKFEWQARRHHPSRDGRTIRDCLVQLRPSGIRVKPPTYAPALVAMAQTPVVGLGDSWRRIGPAEAAVLQGITDFRPWRRVMRKDPTFTAGAAYRQLGNAVNVGIAAYVLQRAIEHLDSQAPGWLCGNDGSVAHRLSNS